ncbi:MAG TPA: D-arabinono-1,4-lactone oxidase, partial [Polyangiaceae bacterium]|nr:D-arabinono-1,4-lactone oxidase [Polyangiaceae bacterium]
IERVRFVDGTGTLHDVSRDDADPQKRDVFDAVCVSMGLLGIVTKVFFRAVPSYALAGQQVTTPTTESAIDFFGDQPGLVSFEDFLRGASYTRLMWWPQSGFDRMVVWQASRAENAPGFVAQPYLELGRAPRVSALAGSLFYTLIGNLDDVTVVPAKLDDWYEALDETLEDDPDPNACKAVAAGPRRKVAIEEVISFLDAAIRRATKKHPKLSNPTTSLEGFLGGLASLVQPHHGSAMDDIVAGIITELVKLLLDGALDNPVAKELGKLLKNEMPYLIDEILGPFVPDGTIWFQDTWMCGLPMDNQMDDRLWPTVFTELWVPVSKAADVMKALRDYYAGGGDKKVAYDHTGAFSCEIYAAKKSPYWLSASYGGDMLRIDVFWFGKNAGDPADSFYPPFWDLLKPFGFRPHWGKTLPTPSAKWVAYYDQQLPRLADFRKLRATLDPDGVFLTPYWKAHLGL